MPERKKAKRDWNHGQTEIWIEEGNLHSHVRKGMTGPVTKRQEPFMLGRLMILKLTPELILASVHL